MKHLALLIFLAVFFFTACQKNGPVSSNTENKTASVNMYFQKPFEIAYLVSSAEAIVSASDMDSMTVPLTVTEEEIYGTIEEIPAGDCRKFEVFTYDTLGNTSYYGTANADVPPGQTIYLNIILYPIEQTGTVIISGTFSDYPEIDHKIVFEDNVNGYKDIFIMNPDGTELLNLTNTDEQDEYYGKLVTDEEKVYYTMFSDQILPRIYTVDMSGGPLTELGILQHMQMVYARYSSDKELLSFYSNFDGDSEIYTYNCSNGTLTQVTNNSTLDRYQDWGPVDEWLVYQSQEPGYDMIYKIRPDGSDKQLLMPGSTFQQRYPDVSPDGQKVLFYGRYGSGGWDLFYVNFDGNNLVRLTSDPTVNHFHGCWSPDGTKILYARIDNSDEDGLYIMDLSGNNNRRIYQSSEEYMYPDWK